MKSIASHEAYGLLKVADDTAFNKQFVSWCFGVKKDPFAKFNLGPLLTFYRRSYLYEMLAEVFANEARVSADPVSNRFRCMVFYQAASYVLEGDVKALGDDAVVLQAHMRAKIFYQLGVVCMELADLSENDDEVIERCMIAAPDAECPEALSRALALQAPKHDDLYDTALAYFEEAAHCYRLVKAQCFDGARLTGLFFSGSDYYAQYLEIDSYTMPARMISIMYNMYVCREEGAQTQRAQSLSSGLSCDSLLSYVSLCAPKSKEDKQALSVVEKKLISLSSQREPSKKMRDEPASKRARKVDAGVTMGFDPSDYASSHEKLQRFLEEVNELNDSELRSTFPTFLYEHQKDTLVAVVRDLSKGELRQLITKPTGTGKTAILYALVCMLAKRNILLTIVVPSSAYLCGQVADDLKKYDQQYGGGELSPLIGVYSPKLGQASLGPIVCLSQAVWTRRMTCKKVIKQEVCDYALDQAKIFSQFGDRFHPATQAVYLVDEAHHLDAHGARAMLEFMKNPVIGVSASTIPNHYPWLTLNFHHSVTEEVLAAVKSAHLKPLQVMTVDLSSHESARQLSRQIKADHINANGDITQEGRQLIEREMIEKKGLTLTVLSVLLQVVRQRKKNVSQSSRVLVFTDFIAHAEMIVKLLKVLDPSFKCKACHSQIEGDSTAVIQDFKEGGFDCLVSVGQIDEGVDIPDANLLVDFSLYKMKIRRCLQRAGRILRKTDDGCDAIIISARLLPQKDDVQLTNADIIFGKGSSKSYAGYEEGDDRLVKAQSCALTKPHDISAEGAVVSASGAYVVYPNARRRVAFCNPPEELDEDQLASSAAGGKAEHVSAHHDQGGAALAGEPVPMCVQPGDDQAVSGFGMGFGAGLQATPPGDVMGVGTVYGAIDAADGDDWMFGLFGGFNPSTDLADLPGVSSGGNFELGEGLQFFAASGDGGLAPNVFAGDPNQAQSFSLTLFGGAQAHDVGGQVNRDDGFGGLLDLLA
jgi:superfamily II DNA or RNA helicase